MKKLGKLILACTLGVTLFEGMEYHSHKVYADTTNVCKACVTGTSTWTDYASLNDAFTALTNGGGGEVQVYADTSFSTTISLKGGDNDTTSYFYTLSSYNGSTVTWTGSSTNAFNFGRSEVELLGNITFTSTSSNSRCFDVNYGKLYYGIDKATALSMTSAIPESFVEPAKAPTITGFTLSDANGAAICAGRSVCELYIGGGKLTNNTSNGTTYGRGGAIHAGGTFYMYAGTISGNSARLGGAISFADYWAQGGTFTMLGGTIENNTSTSGGAAVYCEYGTANLDGGYITGNTVSGTSGDAVVVTAGTLSVTDTYVYDNYQSDGKTKTEANFATTTSGTSTSGSVTVSSTYYNSDGTLNDAGTSALATAQANDTVKAKYAAVNSVAMLSFSYSYDEEKKTYSFTHMGASGAKDGVGLRMGMILPYSLSTNVTGYGIEYSYGTTSLTKDYKTGTKRYTLSDGVTAADDSTAEDSKYMTYYLKFAVTDYTTEYTVKPYVYIGDSKYYIQPKTTTVKEMAGTYLTMDSITSDEDVKNVLTYIAA